MTKILNGLYMQGVGSLVWVEPSDQMIIELLT